VVEIPNENFAREKKKLIRLTIDYFVNKFNASQNHRQTEDIF
jgi:hypothetical protein